MKRNVVPLPGSLSTQMLSAVGFDQSLADGQADAGAGCGRGRMGAVELVEQAQLMFWRDAGTIVVHGDLDRSRDLVRRDGDRGPVGGVLDRVLDQIDQHLRDLDVVEAQQRQIGLDRDGQRVTRRSAAARRARTSTISSSMSYQSFCGRNAPPSIRERSSRLLTISVSRSVSSSIASRKS